MGRTYKRNDLHNSRRPKSIREKRQFQQQNNKDSRDEFSTGNNNQRINFDPLDYE